MLLRFDNGAKGSFSVGQVCAGHKNDLILEICGSTSSLRWRQEHQNELWLGHRDKANEILQKDPSLIDAEVRGYAHLPGGHQESWADAFSNLMRDIYGFIADGQEGDAIRIRRHLQRSKTATAPTASSRRFSRARSRAACGRRWATDDGDTGVRSEVHEGRGADGGAPGVDPARGPRSGSRSRDRGVGGVRARARRRLHPAVGGAASRPRPTCRRRRCSIRSPTRSTCASRSTRSARRGSSACCRRTGSDSRTSATSTTCCTTIRRSGRRSTSSCCGRSTRRCCSASTRSAASSAATRSTRMDENLIDFEQWFIPLLKAAKERGLTYRVEQCPMPGWTTGDNWHNNIAYTPGAWIALHRICEKHGVGDQFRIHYDPSHAILMGQDTRSIFQYLKDEGYNFLIGGFHVKGQVVDAKGVVGLGIRRPDDGARRLEGRQAVAQSGRSGQRVEEAGGARRARAAGHGAARSARVPAEPQRRLARSPAGGARAAEARRRQHAPRRRARISEGADPGQGAAEADPAGLDRVRPAHRRGRGVHVRAAARGARRAEDPDPGRRPPGLQRAEPCRSPGSTASRL